MIRALSGSVVSGSSLSAGRLSSSMLYHSETTPHPGEPMCQCGALARSYLEL